VTPPYGVTPSEFREGFDIYKTKMIGLHCCEETIIIRSAVSIVYRNVTDTDDRIVVSAC